MRLNRLISRRIWRLLQYLALGAILVFFVPTIVSYTRSRSSSSSSSDRSPESHHRHDIPGHVIAKDQGGADNVIDLPHDDPKYWESFKNLAKKDWHDQKAMEEDLARKGAGEQGTPVALPQDAETKKKADDIYRVNGFSGLVSDQIALNRSLKDIRHQGCKAIKYIEKLPTVSVIFPFHNEHWSTLLRSAISVINRSPKGVLKEVILVDDFSSKEFLKKELDDYIEKNLNGMVKVVRTKKREGLIRARQVGALAASADIMVFLDSHSEASYNWLPPLVEPIALDYRTVVCPFVDVIDCDTFEYRAQDEGARGSFDWEFSYKRLPILPEDTKNMPKPFKSPVMAGGYFAISRKYFWELGGYDEGLDIWGGEQYELSFKIWQCHGQMVDAPCSRVGHIYRCKYVPFPNPGVGDFISRNYKRVALVWMDEYKEHLYKRRTNLRDTDPGDLTKQMAVRERLKCKSFDWFMKEVMFDQDKFYPAVEPPDGANGELRNVASNKCVDTQFKGKEERFELRKCVKDDSSVGGEQNIRFSFWKDLRPGARSMCFDVSTSVHHAPIVLFPCHGMQGNQAWKYRFDDQQLFHPVSALCLDCDTERGELFMSKCDKSVKSQQWQFEHLNRTVIESWKYDL